MGHCHSQRAEMSEAIVNNKNFDISKTENTFGIQSKPINQSQNRKAPGLPRVVFVSLYALWQQWDTIDPTTLLESILVINSCRGDLFPATMDELRASANSPISKFHFSPHFFKLLQCKYDQGLLIFMKQNQEECAPTGGSTVKNSRSVSEHQSSVEDFSLSMSPKGTIENSTIELIDNVSQPTAASQWHYISKQLSDIVNPFTHDWYQPLNLVDKYWQNNDNQLRFCDNTNTVLNELSTCDGNHNAMMELFAQSNPNLIPMISFDRHNYELEIIRINSTVSAAVDKPLLKDHDVSSSKYSEFGDIIDNDGYVWLCYDEYLTEN